MGSYTRRHDEIVTVIEDWEGEIEGITKLEVNLEGDAGKIIPVTLLNASEVGTLEVGCVSRLDCREYQLEFNVREKDLGNG